MKLLIPYALCYLQVLLSIAQFFDAMDLLEVGLKLYPDNAEFAEMKGSCHFQLQVRSDCSVPVSYTYT